MTQGTLHRAKQAAKNYCNSSSHSRKRKRNDEISVVSWNVFRLSPRSPQDKLDLVTDNLTKWMQPNNFRPNIIFLCEITRNGNELIDNFNKLNSDYEAIFLENADKNNNISDVSFILIHRKNIKIGQEQIKRTGRDSKRPYIEVEVNINDGKMLAGFCHVTAARREPAAQEITDFVTNLNEGIRNSKTYEAGFLIGDMNFPFDRSNSNLEWIEENLRWKKIRPGWNTFEDKQNSKREIIDYIWVKDYIDCTPHELIPNYFSLQRNGKTLGKIIDHAPIAYTITY